MNYNTKFIKSSQIGTLVRLSSQQQHPHITKNGLNGNILRKWTYRALSITSTPKEESGGGDGGSKSIKNRTITIGDVTKNIVPPLRPELVPTKYLPKDKEIPTETLKHLKWIMQKDILGQDVFLIGRPSPLRRQLAMQYLELTQRELEYVALSRDTTESDLKQRREIIEGTAHYIDQAAVRAASEGRVLVLEGIEKAERNVLPVLNNLLENREMHLEDGRLLIPASRYDKLLEEYSQGELDKWQLVRVSENFRVIALGLPVPQYVGNPLDPPLRSRFQARDIRHLPFSEQLEVLQALGPNVPSQTISQILSFAHTLVTEESSTMGLPDFPVDNLPSLISMLNNAPNMSPTHAIERLYPYKSFLTEDGIKSVEDTLTTFQLMESSHTSTDVMYDFDEISRFQSTIPDSNSAPQANVTVKVGKLRHKFQVPSGHHDFLSKKGEEAQQTSMHDYVPTAFHDMLLAELLLSHSVKDVCLIGPRGCGKSLIVDRMGDLLGYETEHIMLYQDMTARDLLQQRSTLSNGDTIWTFSPLVTAAIEGKLAVLDGIHRIHRGTLAVLHRLVHDRELQLYDGTRLVSEDRYEKLCQEKGLTQEEMAKDSQILKIKNSFRMIALAEPPTINNTSSSSGQWLTPEILSMFMFHTMRPLNQSEELAVLSQLSGGNASRTQENISRTMRDILHMTHILRSSGDSSLSSIANSLSTRQLIRVSKRLQSFPNESAYHAIQKACLTRFLPSLPRETLEKEMENNGMIDKSELKKSSSKEEIADMICKIDDGFLTIGNTSAPIYNPSTKTKVPDTLFYDTDQNLATMEAMLQDYLLGEHLLLVGNQGVGKNKLIDRLLNLLNRPREYLQLHRDTTVQSLTLQPTVQGGVIIYEDSPLVKAVKAGHILVIDEADKAPTHVTCILKTLVESGEMILSDGRRIVRQDKMSKMEGKENVIETHPDFRIIVLANRPGFPFLGNDFFGALGDLFSCHAIDNPSMRSEISMLRQYGPNVPEETLSRLVKAFSELRTMADEGQIQYPYSTREVVNIVKHLEKFPTEGLGNVVRNVFDFDSYNKETKESLNDILRKHGIPIGVSTSNIKLARELDLPNRLRINDWQVLRDGGKNRSRKYMALPFTTTNLSINGPEQVNVSHEILDRTEARGVGFSELQSYWNIPFHDFAIVGDVCTVKDKHNRQLYDQIHVVSSNPVVLYSMKAVDEQLSKVPLNNYFGDPRRSGSNVIPRIKMTGLSGRFASVLAVHDEVSNLLLLVEPSSGAILKISMGGLFDSMLEMTQRLTGIKGGKSNKNLFYRMKTDFAASHNELLFYTPKGNIIELISLEPKGQVEPASYQLELPFNIKSVHPLSRDQYLIEVINDGMMDDISNAGPSQIPGSGNLFMLKKDSSDDAIPYLLSPISQSSATISEDVPADVEFLDKETKNLTNISSSGLTDHGLSKVFGSKISSPHSLIVSEDTYAGIVLGFPELEFSPSEVHVWQRPTESIMEFIVLQGQDKPSPSNYGGGVAKKFSDPTKNIVILRNSSQIVRPVSYSELPKDAISKTQGPGNITAYLEVVDLMQGKLRFIPVPEPAQMSVYASWYKQTYPDQIVACSETSNEGLVTVDNVGTVRLWETGVDNLSRSLSEWRTMVGGDKDRDLMLMRDKVGDLDSPKHGKMDPDNAPHVGGNTWAGGTGGRDTAGLGGVGGPYRLDAGHNVHQVSDEVKNQVPEHIRKAAREMNRKAYKDRLREIQMSEHDAAMYEQFSSQVRKQVQALRMIISGLQAKAKDRQWLKNQTSGELDDTKLIEGITGEKAIYKKRGEQEPEPGAPQEKPKRLRLLVDLSGSMYRFNGHDSRLERTMESSLMVMEALEGYSQMIRYEIMGHSGEESDLPLVKIGNEPKNEKERLHILRNMHAHAQFCMSGDHTLSATVQAVNELALSADNYDESIVIVLSDANFDRYGISPTQFAKILTRNERVNAFAIFIGSLGDQAEYLARKLPSGKGFVCLDTRKIPEIMKTIFTSTMLK